MYSKCICNTNIEEGREENISEPVSSLNCCAAAKMSTSWWVDISYVNRCSGREKEVLNSWLIFVTVLLKLTVMGLKSGCHDQQIQPGF